MNCCAYGSAKVINIDREIKGAVPGQKQHCLSLLSARAIGVWKGCLDECSVIGVVFAGEKQARWLCSVYHV